MVLSNLTDEYDFKQFFKMYSMEIIIQIVIPYLTLTAEEKDQVVSEPTEFINAIDDVCGE